MNKPTVRIATIIAAIGAVMTVVACGDDNPINGDPKQRIVTYGEFLQLKPSAVDNLRDAWEIIGDEGKLKSVDTQGRDTFTWIWLNSDGSSVECDFRGPTCFDEENPEERDRCWDYYQHMQTCRQSGL